jgi:hypothetical protein
MYRAPPSIAFLLLCVLVPSVAESANLFGDFYAQNRTLTSPIPDPIGMNQFGIAVAIRDGVALVGAPRESVSGNAYLFGSHTGALLHTLSPTTQTVQNFGRTVALEDGYAVVGSEVASYVYDVNSYALLHMLPAANAIDIEDGRVILDHVKTVTFTICRPAR